MNNNLKPIETLRPFTRFLCTIGELPTSYLISMTYEEQVLWLCNYLEKTVIPTINNNAEAVEELKNLVLELQHYLDNLDLQDEVDNKLDEMAEDGTLAEIINQQLFDELDNQINDSNYYNLTYSTGRIYNTDYYVTTIPKYENSEIIPLSVNMDTTKTPLQYAEANNTTITANGGMTYQNEQDVWKQNLVIGNGEILNPVPVDITLPDYYTFLGFDEQRNVYEYQANTLTAQQALNDGVKNGYVVFYRYMNNGVLDETHNDAPNWDVKSPRLDIGIKANGDLIILACDGRTNNNVGLTNTEALEIMQLNNCIKAWRTDGGGSTSLIYKGSKINRNIDDNGTTDRKIDVTFNIKHSIINQERADIYSFIGKDRQLLNKQIRNDMSSKFLNYQLNMSKLYYQTNDNSINNITSDTADTYVPMYLTGKFRHGNNITPLKDENNKIIGFNLNANSLYRIVVIALIETHSVGERIIKITTGDNDTTDWLLPQILGIEGSTRNEQIVIDTVINNNTGTTKIVKLWKRGKNQDRWLRITAYCEQIGDAESSPSP